VPPAMVPALAPGQKFELKAVATAAGGESGRDDVEVEANFGGGVSTATSIVDALPALIVADGVSSSTVVITPQDSLGIAAGTGLAIQAQATQGTLGPVVDVGDGTPPLGRKILILCPLSPSSGRGSG